MDTIFKRRSIRSYQNKKVESKKMTQLLKAAMEAPSAGIYPISGRYLATLGRGPHSAWNIPKIRNEIWELQLRIYF